MPGGVVLEKLKNLGSARGAASGFLKPIDTALIAKQLGLERLCVVNGESNVPASNARTLDDVEQTIVQTLQGEWSWQGNYLLEELRTYAQRLTEYSIATEFQKLRLAGNNAVTQLRAAHFRAEAELGPLRGSFQAYRDDLSHFRTKHRLARAVRDPANRWTAFGLLLLMIVFEMLLNGVLFAEGSELGLVGGVGIAAGLSIFNVSIAFLLGWGPARWVHHRNFLLKFVALIIVIAGVAGLLSLHAFATHLRDATIELAKTNPYAADDEALRIAVDSINSNPLSVASLASGALFGLGVLFALLAFWKGYSFDDPYPGYGAHHRRASSAREEYSDEHANFFDSLRDIKDGTVEELRAGIDRIPKLPQLAASVRASRTAMLQQFRAYENGIETAVNQLLAQYRRCNRASRSEPAPPHFEQDWSLPDRFADSADVGRLLADPDLPQGDVASDLTDLSELSERVLAEYETLMRAYPHPTQMQ